MRSFFAPTPPKLVFLAEWVLFLALEGMIGALNRPAQFPGAGLPLVFFYLCGCACAWSAGRGQSLGSFGALLGVAALLALLDQAAKLAVLLGLGSGGQVVLIPGGLVIVQSLNLRASWFLDQFNLEFVSVALLSVLSILFLLLLAFGYRYYLANRRSSRWSGLAFVFLFAGVASALGDQVLRGYTVDFIGLSGLVAADLKDIWLSLGIACLLAELLSAPPAFQAQAGLGLKGLLHFAAAETAGWIRRIRNDPRL
jgi:lipoprotein signal peptidase